MKLEATLVLLVALAGGAGAFSWRALRTESGTVVHEPELQWLQREFALSDDTVLRIAELHRRYTAECEPICAELHTSDAELSRLIATQRHVTPELEAALKRSNKIIAECQRRMVGHFYAVAKEMSPPARERYLALMTPIAAHPEKGWKKINR